MKNDKNEQITINNYDIFYVLLMNKEEEEPNEYDKRYTYMEDNDDYVYIRTIRNEREGK